ncbi:MAG: N-acetylmuramoyl-L-alanine amidase, partial [Proteobacteria bacterium]|nr:N-acetylmuramoyl-L-alanine amidase [Pseudomonadota bacterium]
MAFRPIYKMTLLALLAVNLAVASHQARAAEAEVTDIRAGVHGLATRIVVDLDRPVTARVFTLTSPARLVIDLPEVGWRLPARPLPGDVGVLARLRYGLFKPGNSRVVVDLNQPARVHAAVALPAASGQPNRLVIDLARSSGTDFLAQTAAGPLLIEGDGAKIARAEPTLAAKAEPAAAPAPAPALAPPAVKPAARPERQAVALPAKTLPAGQTSKLANLRVPIKPAGQRRPAVRNIVIDPGHGGVDPGAIGVSGIYEKHITLAAARDIKERLEATGRFRVSLTRDR